MGPTIRRALPLDADFIAWTILTSQRGHRPRGWFDIALNRPEPQCLSFVARIAVARTVSWWHTSQFLIAEVEGSPAAALCALPAAGTGAAARSAIEEGAGGSGPHGPELSAIFLRGEDTQHCWIQGGAGDWLRAACPPPPPFSGR